MESELIILSEYCSNANIDPQFIILLENEGLINIHIVDYHRYVAVSQLVQIERYARWHYDLSINIEGIDVIRNLLEKMDAMQTELNKLRRVLKIEADETYSYDI